MKRVVVIIVAALSALGCEEPASRSAGAAPTVSPAPPADTAAAAPSPTPPAEPRVMTDSNEKAETSEKVELSEAEWKQRLTPEQYYVLRQKGTERPFTNKYDKHFEPGMYSCAACGLELFESDTKFDSGCGWPAFYAAKAGERVDLHQDLTLGMVRTEVTCARCGSHLGHVFEDAPQTPTGNRFCINSVSLTFTPKPPEGKSPEGKHPEGKHPEGKSPEGEASADETE